MREDVGEIIEWVSTQRIFRVLMVLLIIASLSQVAQSYTSYSAEIGDRTSGNGNYAVQPPQGITVVTTAPRAGATASLVSYFQSGEVQYYNETYDWYYDVDPVTTRAETVEYVATDVLPQDECPRELREGCHLNVIERVNLSTGEVNRIHTDFAPGAWGGWHDVDRINETHLLVAGIREDRVFILNTSSDLIEWQWDADSYFEPTSGGMYSGDWTHLNDVEYLPDGRVMVSVRNQDRVVFIHRSRGVQPEWTLGEEDNYEILHEQHNPDFIPASDGGPSVLVSDSENNRVVEYQRDGGSWVRTWGWTGAEMQWPRDADRLPDGHTLISDSDGNRVLEIDQSGEVVWQMNIDTPYDVERLGTGDESRGGSSATSLGLTARDVSGDPSIGVEPIGGPAFSGVS